MDNERGREQVSAAIDLVKKQPIARGAGGRAAKK